MNKLFLTTEFQEIINEHIPHLSNILNSFDGVYLAGGLLRTLVSPDEELSPDKTDVDLFFRDIEVRDKVKDYLEKHTPYYKFYQCPEDKLASYVFLDGEEPKWKIQLITVDFYPTLENVISSFDFTVTMFGTDGIYFVYGETSMQDVIDKHLVWNRITYPASSLRRMMKYSRKGYWMKEEDYQEFTNQLWTHYPTITDEKLVYVD